MHGIDAAVDSHFPQDLNRDRAGSNKCEIAKQETVGKQLTWTRHLSGLSLHQVAWGSICGVPQIHQLTLSELQVATSACTDGTEVELIAFRNGQSLVAPNSGDVPVYVDIICSYEPHIIKMSADIL